MRFTGRLRRRMTEAAARLVDAVLPRPPVRQWVLSLPYRLRYLLAWDHALARAVLGVSVRVLLGFQRHRARRYGIRDGRSGSVTVIQRFGRGLNLNLHFHTLLFDGVFFEGQRRALEFWPLPPPTDDEVGVVLARIATRVQRLLKRRGFDPDRADVCPADPVVEESPALAGISSASVQGRIALGPRAGARVWRLGDDPDAPWVLSTAPRHAHLAGFDLHANVAVPAADRARLEQLCRYLLRPAVAQDRLRRLDDGRVVLTLKSPWADGTRHLLFEPLTLLEKLAALIPRPRINLVLYHGVLGSHCGWRARVVAYGAPPEVAPAIAGATPNEDDGPTSAPVARHWAWAALMRRAFDIDVLACPRCGGRLPLIATVEDPGAIRAILDALAGSRELVGRPPPPTAAVQSASPTAAIRA
jgi:putative transposase